MLSRNTLNDFVTYWIDNVKSNEIKTGSLMRLKSEQKALQQFRISNMRICDIRLHDIQTYVNELVKAGYGYNTIAKQRLIVTAPLRYAHQAEIIDRDCTRGVRMPNKESTQKPIKEVIPLSLDEQHALVAVLRKDARPTSPLLEFLLETGLRVGEAQALTWRNVDFNRRCISIKATALNTIQSSCKIQSSPKTRSSVRTIPLSQRALEIVNSLPRGSDNKCVFSDENGEPLNYGRIAKHYKSACKRAGIEHYGVHSLRHTFATNCYYKGCDIKILSKLLGHSSTTITYNTYIDLYGDGLEEMRKVII